MNPASETQDLLRAGWHHPEANRNTLSAGFAYEVLLATADKGRKVAMQIILLHLRHDPPGLQAQETADKPECPLRSAHHIPAENIGALGAGVPLKSSIA